MLERLSRADKIGHFIGDIELTMQYQSGRAGQIFMQNLRDKGLLTFSKCLDCNSSFIPPKIYCPYCMGNKVEYQTIEPVGRVDLFTVCKVDSSGNKLSKPEIIALIRFKDIKGGLIHRIEDVNEAELKQGMEVVAVLKKEGERTGSISDILYFKPAT